jgi:CBS domain-containing protein
MKLLEICDEAPARVPPTATVKQAIELMLERRVGAVAIVDADEHLVGIFTERDVLRKVALSGRDPGVISIREVMTSTIETATAETTAGEAMGAMVNSHFRHLPIVDKGGKLLGLISIRNLLQARVDEVSQELDSLEQYVSNDGPGG